MDLLTAAERRKSTQNMKQLNALLSDYDLTRDVATQRLKQELETESHRRAARTKAWEVDALTRAFRSNAFAKREEKEVARLVRQQFDQVAHLLEQKRIGLNHYYHDQFQIVKENVAQQNKMKELHAKVSHAVGAVLGCMCLCHDCCCCLMYVVCVVIVHV